MFNKNPLIWTNHEIREFLLDPSCTKVAMLSSNTFNLMASVKWLKTQVLISLGSSAVIFIVDFFLMP
jgi:hypothetical protein